MVQGNRRQPRLVLVGAALALIGIAAPGIAQEKKDGKRFKSAVVELTDDAPSRWILKEAKVGAPMISDRDYKISDLPDEAIGGTLLLRPAGDFNKWLDTGELRALNDATVYIMIRWKYLGKEVIDEVTRTKLERDGWDEVEGRAGTTCPNEEDWRWKIYSKKIKKGEVILLLKTTSWNKWPVLYIFK
jgi:hypothetical protein